MRRLGFITAALCSCALLLGAGRSGSHTMPFDPPIDGVSFGLTNSSTVEVRVWIAGTWTEWQTLTVDTEDDSATHETNVQLFPEKTERIEFRGDPDAVPHPIRISSAPTKVSIAALLSYYAPRPRILSRKEWGADDSLLYSDGSAPAQPENNVPTDENAPVSTRLKDCQSAQKNYPEEFKAARAVTTDAQGKKYTWPQSYSPSVKLLVVHHTAQLIRGDNRTPIERMRALYQYHAKSLGWGDIGYHYIVDETGQIYEGRAGGNSVIGGHTYCANVGTIGIALIGNFEQEQPTQDQVKSLQWLLRDLTDRYHLNRDQKTTFHGKSLPVIVGHRDLVSTSCPGYFLYGALDQIRSNVSAGTTSTSVMFPDILATVTVDRTAERRSARMQSLGIAASPLPILLPIGSTAFVVRPGGQVTTSITYRAGKDLVMNRARVASVVRSSPRIGIWQALGGDNVRVRSEILLPRTLQANELETIRLKFQLPEDAGTYTVDIGTATLTFDVSGRRTRSPISASVPMTSTPDDRINIPTPGAQRAARAMQQQSSGSSGSSESSDSSPSIRLRLSSLESNQASCADFTLSIIQSRYRGTVACQMVANTPVIINTLSLEEYMAGVAEEPDTEPYEKQRAFAIAARSYAAYYLDPQHRKFPGMPYDGDDSPARFQLYKGLSAELGNPRWVRAVRSTAGQVLTKNDQIVKAAYFSSDDGRTRSPDEQGWKNFPFAEIFASKSDPWCAGLPLNGHGVGMSGCGAKGQAQAGKSAEEILQYYYPGTEIRNE